MGNEERMRQRKRGRIESAVISQVLRWFITQTQCTAVLLKDT